MVKIRSREEILDMAKGVISKIERTLDDYYFVDKEQANTLISFISLMRHTGGDLAGVNFQLLPFQIEFLVSVICIKNKETGRRKHTTALLMIPRKNGKTEVIAALLNYFLFADKESGKEIYCAANETDQAKIIFKATESMINQNKTLKKKCSIFKSTKTIEKKSEYEDFIKVLTSNADTKDGLKPYVVVYDELHAAKSPELYTVLEEGMAHRSNPLFIIISTAGYNHQGIMKKKYDYAKQVKAGIIKDPSFYSMIFEPDEGDDWMDEKVWVKCNPAIGYGVKLEYLKNKFIKAQHSSSDEVAFKTKHLNIWTSSAEAWIRNEDWEKSYRGKINVEHGAACFAGLDLSSTTDITAFVMLFPTDEGYDVLPRFWIPEDNMRERERRDKVPYSQWVRDGYIFATEGNVIDYAFIEAQIRADCETYNVKELAYDRWNATDIITRLNEDGVATMVPFGQGFASMNAPTKEIETLVLQKKLNHGNNPVLTWMMSNVAIRTDPAGNIKIDKSKSSEKVDGMVALAMALGRAMVHERPQKSIYESRGVLTV